MNEKIVKFPTRNGFSTNYICTKKMRVEAVDVVLLAKFTAV